MLLDPAIDETELIIENAVGELYRALFRLRLSEQYQREYDTMGTIIDMLMKDRQHLRTVYKVDM